MRALTVEPLAAGSARLEDVPEPDPTEGDVLVEAVAVGVDGTDQRSSTEPTGGPRPAASAWSWATSPWVAW